MVALHVHTRATVFVSRRSTGGQLDRRSAHDKFSQISQSCDCGAARFLFWWLFLHRRLRSGNEAQLTSSCSLPSAGPCRRVPLVFIRVARESLAALSSRAFRLRLKASIGLAVRLPLLSPGASPHRSPIPSSVSKTVTFVTRALYATRSLRSIFCVFYFQGT